MAFSQHQLVASAARSGNVALLRERVAAGGDPTQSGALLIAIAAGHGHAITALLELGADPNAPDHHGHASLDYAIRLGNATLVRELLSYGARLTPHSRGHWSAQLEQLLSQPAS